MFSAASIKQNFVRKLSNHPTQKSTSGDGEGGGDVLFRDPGSDYAGV